MRKIGAAFVLDASSEAVLVEHLREMRRRELRPSSMQHRRATVQQFGRFISPKPLLDVVATDIESWMDSHIDRGLSAASRRSYTSHVRTFYGWVTRRGLIAVDPAVDVVPTKVAAGMPRPISEKDLELALICAGQPLRAWIVGSSRRTWDGGRARGVFFIIFS